METNSQRYEYQMQQNQSDANPLLESDGAEFPAQSRRLCPTGGIAEHDEQSRRRNDNPANRQEGEQAHAGPAMELAFHPAAVRHEAVTGSFDFVHVDWQRWQSIT